MTIDISDNKQTMIKNIIVTVQLSQKKKTKQKNKHKNKNTFIADL